MHLDPRTLGVTSNVMAVCLTALILLLWLNRMYPGFGRWTAARMIGVLTLLFSVQIGKWPHAILFADAFGMFSAILTLEACRQFIGLRTAVPWTYAAAGALLIQLACADLFFGWPQASYIELTFVWGAMFAWTGITLLRQLPPGPNRGRVATGIVFMFHSLVYMGRSVYFLANASNTLVDSAPLNLAFLIENMLSGVMLNLSFILMHYERALADKAEEAGRAAKANETLSELKASLEERVRQGTAELLQARKLDSVGRLAGGIAHDFNNILTVINGHSLRLLGQVPPDDRMYEPIAEIARAGDRAAALTRQLLAFSRQQKDEPRIVSANALILGLMEMLRRLIGEDIEISFAPDAGVCSVRADAGQLEQVIMNLAINARDAMPDGGQLFIETSDKMLDDDFAAACLSVPPGRYTAISVTDTGTGMTPEVQSRLFEPFFTTKEPDKGTGLGLSTVYGIVKQSGGAVTVHSSPGLGTTFHIYLPAVDVVAEESHVRTLVSAPARGSETVLVVEDQTDLRRFVRGVLEEHGYSTLEASNGGDAIALADSYPGRIHLLITDLVLPGMNGWEIVSRIRAARPDIQVLRMSGYSDQLGRQLDNSTPYIQKPFTGDALLRKIRSVLDPVRDESSVLIES